MGFCTNAIAKMTLFRTNGVSDQWVFGPMGLRTNDIFLDQFIKKATFAN